MPLRLFLFKGCHWVCLSARDLALIHLKLGFESWRIIVVLIVTLLQIIERMNMDDRFEEEERNIVINLYYHLLKKLLKKIIRRKNEKKKEVKYLLTSNEHFKIWDMLLMIWRLKIMRKTKLSKRIKKKCY